MRLHRLGENCEFDKYSLDEAIKDQLIEHCCSARLRRRLLREKSSTSLSSLLEIARSMKSADFQAANMENTSSHDRSENARHLTDSSISEADEQVNFIYDSRRKYTRCGNVADDRPRTPKCPVFHETCSQCGIQHHFSRVCMKKIPTPGRPQEQKTAHPKVKCVYDYNDDDEKL